MYSMDELDSTSNFSSIAEAPGRLDKQYAPLSEVFESHSTELPDQGSPESNSEAMIKALKALQEKIRTLELDRAAAANRFHHMAEETHRHATRATSSLHSHDSEDLKQHLQSLDTKFMVQAEELEAMRKRLRQSEEDKHDALAKTRQLEQQQRELLDHQEAVLQQERAKFHTPTTAGVGSQTLGSIASPMVSVMSKEAEEKLMKLERDHARMSAVHSLTESRIHELEKQLREEQWHRKRIQDQTAQIQASTDSNDRKKKEQRKRKMSHRSRGNTCTCFSSGLSVCRCKPGVHYRLNAKDVPFVVGTSTEPSHSLSANYQSMLAAMKRHSSLLCGAVASQRQGLGRGRKNTGTRGAKGRDPKSLLGTASQREMESLLDGLEEEFGHLTFEHQELARTLQEEKEARSIEVLETQLRHISDSMEKKTEQIKTVKKHLAAIKKKGTALGSSSTSRTALKVPRNGQVEVLTTVKTRESSKSCSASGKGCKTQCRSGSTSPNLRLLRRMQEVKNTLQRDDLSWD